MLTTNTQMAPLRTITPKQLNELFKFCYQRMEESRDHLRAIKDNNVLFWQYSPRHQADFPVFNWEKISSDFLLNSEGFCGAYEITDAQSDLKAIPGLDLDLEEIAELGRLIRQFVIENVSSFREDWFPLVLASHLKKCGFQLDM